MALAVPVTERVVRHGDVLTVTDTVVVSVSSKTGVSTGGCY